MKMPSLKGVSPKLVGIIAVLIVCVTLAVVLSGFQDEAGIWKPDKQDVKELNNVKAQPLFTKAALAELSEKSNISRFEKYRSYISAYCPLVLMVLIK